jgi:hypothetical protein
VLDWRGGGWALARSVKGTRVQAWAAVVVPFSYDVV